jgi:hypothetical protein
MNDMSTCTLRFPADFVTQLSQALTLASFGDAADELPALLIQPAAKPTAPLQLARCHPGGPKAQRSARALYLRCLGHYRHKVQRGLPVDDLGAAAAYFVLANLAALQGLAVTKPQLALVERQMRHLIGRNDAWANADARARQVLFEQFALLGVLVGESQALARSQGAAAVAHVRQAALRYLSQLLELNPEVLRLTDRGLTIEADSMLPAAAVGALG